MNALRINLSIRPDVSPILYEALSKLPPRPRAELLRKVAEFGLTARVASSTDTHSHNQPANPLGVQSSRDSMGVDLMQLIEKGGF